jgi:hypothetical protein
MVTLRLLSGSKNRRQHDRIIIHHGYPWIIEQVKKQDVSTRTMYTIVGLGFVWGEMSTSIKESTIHAVSARSHHHGRCECVMVKHQTKRA